ncbi:hypothetical protein ACTHSL_12160 [Neisseria sp. P0008.S010]|uniref:hypothetical protein n=1 Tax=Neisseria sp. P0008.S010 TaxID=3436707 RepID=UPI003F7FF255
MKVKLLFIPMLCIPFIALAKPSDLVCKKRVDLEMGYEQHCVYSGSLSQAFHALGARVELWKPFLKYGLPKKDSDFRGYLARKGRKDEILYGVEWKGENKVSVSACWNETDNCSMATFQQSNGKVLIKLYESP